MAIDIVLRFGALSTLSRGQERIRQRRFSKGSDPDMVPYEKRRHSIPAYVHVRVSGEMTG